MTLGGQLRTLTIPASADLSAYRNRWVYQNDAGGAALLEDMSGVGTVPLGILTNEPAAQGQAASIAVLGSDVQLDTAGSIATGQLVVAVADGKGSGVTSGTTWVGGLCVRGASEAGVPCAVLVSPFWLRAD